MLLFFLACASETTLHGTFVGNPGKGKANIASSEDIALSQARTTLREVFYTDGIHEYTRSYEQDVDILNNPEGFPIYKGNWEFIAFEFAPGLQLQGSAHENAPFLWEPDSLVIIMELTTPIQEEGNYFLEFGSENWIPADEILANFSSAPLNLGEVPEIEENLFTVLMGETSLYHDQNQDGIISEEERNSPTGTAILDEDFTDISPQLEEFWDSLIEEDDEDDD